jgi:hypothetical protein
VRRPLQRVDRKFVAGSDLGLDQGAQKLSGDHRCVLSNDHGAREARGTVRRDDIDPAEACALSVDPVRANE